MSRDGGPAFPGFDYVEGHGSMRLNGAGQWEMHAPGMSLRDYFAAKALQSLIADEGLLEETGDDGYCAEDVALDAANMAKRSYIVADAMLRAREAL